MLGLMLSRVAVITMHPCPAELESFLTKRTNLMYMVCSKVIDDRVNVNSCGNWDSVKVPKFLKSRRN